MPLPQSNSIAKPSTSQEPVPGQDEASQFSISSLRSLTWHEPSKVKDVKNYSAAYASANPNAYNDRPMKAAATKGYINKQISNPAFQQLDPHNKVFALHLLYDRWISPTLKDQGVNPPSFDEWAAGVPASTANGPVDTRPKGTLSKTFSSSTSESLGNDVELAANVVKTLFGHSKSAANNADVYRFANKLHATAATMKKVNSDYLSQFNTADTRGNWLANMAGQAVGLAPMFALADATGGASLEAMGLEEGAGLTEQILSLGERANLGGSGSKIALRAMTDSGEQYGISKGYGETDTQAKIDAGAMAILGGTLGSIFHGVSKVSDSGLKSLFKKTIDQGAGKLGVAGEGLVNSVADTTSELNPKAIGDISKEEFMATSLPKSTAQRIQSLVNDDDPHFLEAKQQEIKLREQWAQHFFPELAAKASISSTELPPDLVGSSPRYKTFKLNFEDPRDKALYIIANPNSRSAAHDRFMSYLREQFPNESNMSLGIMGREVRDQIKGLKPDGNTITVKGSRGGTTGTTGRTYKVWDKLSKLNRSRIMAQMEAVQKSGANLMPLVKPEVQLAHNVNMLEQLAKSDPARVARMQALEKATGVNPAVAMTQAQATETAGEIGVNPSQQNLEEAFSEEDYTPLEGESASLGTGYNVSYLRNYAPSVDKLIGRDVPTSKFLSGTIKYLEKNSNTESGHLYYEHPKMHLLALAFNSDAPTVVKARAKRILANEFNTDLARQRYEAGWLKFHVERLRDSGHVEGGNNPGRIFRSTKLMIPRYGTKYQNMLTPELAAMYSKEMVSKISKQDPKLAASLNKFYQMMSAYTVKANKSDTAMDRLGRLRNIHSEITEMQ